MYFVGLDYGADTVIWNFVLENFAFVGSSLKIKCIVHYLTYRDDSTDDTKNSERVNF